MANMVIYRLFQSSSSLLCDF